MYSCSGSWPEPAQDEDRDQQVGEARRPDIEERPADEQCEADENDRHGPVHAVESRREVQADGSQDVDGEFPQDQAH